MAQTRPTGEQLRFRSANTGEHVLDTYLEAAEKGGRTLTDLLDDVFDSTTGEFRADNFDFRFDSNTHRIQFRIGQFTNSADGWEFLTSFFNHRGVFAAYTNYDHFDLVEVSNNDVYIVHPQEGVPFAASSEAQFIASSRTTKLIDVASVRDWARKTDGDIDGVDYSAKAWAIGGTGVTDTNTRGAAKEWAAKTTGTVDTVDYSAKEYAQGTQAGAGGSAKDWATKTTADVDGIDYSAKEYAVGTQIRGTTGSAKDWAQYTAGTVDGTNYSAKYWATNTDVTTVSSNIADISTVATDITNVNTVASDITNVNTVALAITDVSTVSSDIAAVITAANDLNEATSEIDTVANSIANVDLVGADITNVNTVATNISNVNTVAGDTTEINAVYADLAEINSVYTNLSGVNTVANALGGTVTYTVTVSGGVFYIDGAANPVLTIKRGFTYVFDQSDSSNNGHQIAFEDNNGNTYVTGVTTTGTAGTDGETTFIVPTNAPSNLVYTCTTHGTSMGNTISVTDDTFSAAVAISSDIVTVAGIDTDVSSVASAINDIQTVNTNTTDIQTVASEISPINNVSTVAAVSAQIQNVAAQITPTNNIATVAGVTSDISTLAGISGDVTTAAGSAADITAIAGEITPTNNISTVAGISTDISTVSGISGDVTTVAGISSDVTTVAGIDASVSSVANIAADVSGVSTISGAVTAVNNNSTDISTVAGQITPTNNVATVAGVATDIATIGSISTDVSDVAVIDADVTTVAGISSDVTTVAGISSDVTTVAANDANVTTVANNIADAVTFVERYRVDTTDPTTSLDAGDLYFNTTNNVLKVYNGTVWDQPYYSTSGGTITGNMNVTGSATIGVTFNVNGTANINDLDNVQTGDIAALTVGTLTQGSTWNAPYSEAKSVYSLKFNDTDYKNSWGVSFNSHSTGEIAWYLAGTITQDATYLMFSDYQAAYSYSHAGPASYIINIDGHDLTQSTYTKTDLTVTKSTTVTHPLNSNLYADLIVPNATVSSDATLTQGLYGADTSSNYVYINCWVKPNGYDQIEFRIKNTYAGGPNAGNPLQDSTTSDSYWNYLRLNLSTFDYAVDGSGTNFNNFSSTTQNSDGWVHLRLRTRHYSAGNKTLQIRVGTGTGNSWAFGGAGDGTSGIYISDLKIGVNYSYTHPLNSSKYYKTLDGHVNGFTEEDKQAQRMAVVYGQDGYGLWGAFVDPISKKYGVPADTTTDAYSNDTYGWTPSLYNITQVGTVYGQFGYATGFFTTSNSDVYLQSGDSFSSVTADRGYSFSWIVHPGDVPRMAFGSSTVGFNTYDFTTESWVSASDGSGGNFYYGKKIGPNAYLIHVGFDYNTLIAAGGSSSSNHQPRVYPLGATQSIDYTAGVNTFPSTVSCDLPLGTDFSFTVHRAYYTNDRQFTLPNAAYPRLIWPVYSSSGATDIESTVSLGETFADTFRKLANDPYSGKGALYLTFELPHSNSVANYDRFLLAPNEGAANNRGFLIMRRPDKYGSVFLTNRLGQPIAPSSSDYLLSTTTNTNIPDEFQMVLSWDNTVSGGSIEIRFGNGDVVTATDYFHYPAYDNHNNNMVGLSMRVGSTLLSGYDDTLANFPMTLNSYVTTSETANKRFACHGVFTGAQLFDQPLTAAHANKLFNDYRNSGL